jgi:hypothetical protein
MTKKYPIEHQELFITMMLTEHDLFARCSNILLPKYFDKKLSPIVKFMHEYAEDYNVLPKFEIVNAKFKTKFNVVTDLGNGDKDWFFKTIEDFCRLTAIEQAIIKGSDMLDKGEYGGLEDMVKEATLISLQRDMGTNYFENPRERLERLKEQNGNISTGWKTVDNVVYQVGRGELIFFAAISGGGKSVALANTTVNFAKQGLNVIYITLELSEELVAKRLDAMMTGVSNANIFKSMDEVTEKVESAKNSSGNIYIKYMDPGTSPSDIRAYLREFMIQTGIKPDALVIDYMDLMHPDQRGFDLGNLSAKDKLVSEALRKMGSPKNYNMVVFSAAQIGRCLDLNTKVITDNGEVKLADVKVGDKIMGNNGMVDIKKVYPIEEQEVYRIKTKSGKVIECSARHIFPTVNGEKSIADGLSVGDKLYVKSNIVYQQNLEDKISKIEYVGKKKTIDIEVSGNNLFYANDILTHNSGYGEETVGMNHVAGGLSKFQTCDIAIYIHNTAQLRERGEIEFQFLKTRNSGGVGTHLSLAYDTDTLVISDLNGANGNGSSDNPPSKQKPIHATSEKNIDNVKKLLNQIKKS